MVNDTLKNLLREKVGYPFIFHPEIPSAKNTIEFRRLGVYVELTIDELDRMIDACFAIPSEQLIGHYTLYDPVKELTLQFLVDKTTIRKNLLACRIRTLVNERAVNRRPDHNPFV